MRGVIRRALLGGVLSLLLATSVATAAAPEGPRLAVVKVTAKPYRVDLWTVAPNGGRRSRLAGRSADPRLLFVYSPISWSADGEQGVFSGVVGVEKGDDQEPLLRLFAVRADGSDLRVIPGTKNASAPVFSPDGRTVAFTRSLDRETPTTVGGKPRKKGFYGSSIWTVDLQTGAQRQLTPWRERLYSIASSFSPDGSTLLATVEGDPLTNEAQPVALNLDSGVSRRLYDDGFSPVFSPDGSRIVFVRYIEEYGEERGETSDLFVANADGSGLRRLTRTPGRYEFGPSWDPSGERLAYVRLSPARADEGLVNAGIMQINADGTCPTKMFSTGRSGFSVPVWQPGPGRGAGRIEC